MSAKQIDTLYLQGKGQDDPFSFYYANLRPLLLEYAVAIGNQHHKQIDDHQVTEMVDDLLMDLDKFEGKSSLSTWVYARFRNQWVKEFRFQRKNLGSSLSLEANIDRNTGYKDGQSMDTESRTLDYFTPHAPYTSASAPDMADQLIVEDFKNSLSARQLDILESRIAGHTFEEIADELQLSSSRAHEIWTQILSAATEYGLDRIK